METGHRDARVRLLYSGSLSKSRSLLEDHGGCKGSIGSAAHNARHQFRTLDYPPFANRWRSDESVDPYTVKPATGEHQISLSEEDGITFMKGPEPRAAEQLGMH